MTPLFLSLEFPKGLSLKATTDWSVGPCTMVFRPVLLVHFRNEGNTKTLVVILQVDPSGPLATLRKLLLSEEAFVSLRDFLMSHWYAAIFIILAIGGLMVSDFQPFRLVSSLMSSKALKESECFTSHLHYASLPWVSINLVLFLDYFPTGPIITLTSISLCLTF